MHPSDEDEFPEDEDESPEFDPEQEEQTELYMETAESYICEGCGLNAGIGDHFRCVHISEYGEKYLLLRRV